MYLFKKGDKVKIIAGSYTNRTGSVIGFNRTLGKVIVMLDNPQHFSEYELLFDNWELEKITYA